MQPHTVNARLPDEQVRQLGELRDRTGQSTSEIVRAAISHYHRLVVAPPRSTIDIVREAGLVGCLDGEPTLSESYKSAMAEALGAKHRSG